MPATKNAVMEANRVVIKIEKAILDYAGLMEAKGKIDAAQCSNVTLDLSRVEMMTTAAFAQLLIIKRALMRAGGDLRIRGLRDQPRALCEVLKLCGLTEAGRQ